MEKNKKYELTDTINHYGDTLYRIKALISFGDVKAGDIGGYVESEDNLSHEGDCWIFDNAIVKDEAKVLDNVTVFGNAQVLDHAIVKDYTTVADNAVVTGYSKVYEYARVSGNATVNETSEVYGHAAVRGNANLHSTVKVFGTAIVSGDAIVSDNSKVYGRSIVIENALVNGASEIYGYSIVCGDACITDANIYDKARVASGVIVGSTINGNTVINIHGCLKNNAYISNINDYINIIMNGIILTFYLSKDKDIYFTFGGHEYKLGNLNSYTEELNDIIGFPMIIELAKKYLLKEREENE